MTNNNKMCLLFYKLLIDTSVWVTKTPAEYPDTLYDRS